MRFKLLTTMALAICWGQQAFGEGQSVAFSLMAVDGEFGGYCVVKESSDGSATVSRQGALTEGQIKKALRVTGLFAGAGAPILHTLHNEQEYGSLNRAVSPIMETYLRQARFDAITDEGIEFVPIRTKDSINSTNRLSEVKGHIIMERVASQKPKFPSGCDYLSE